MSALTSITAILRALPIDSEGRTEAEQVIGEAELEQCRLVELTDRVVDCLRLVQQGDTFSVRSMCKQIADLFSELGFDYDTIAAMRDRVVEAKWAAEDAKKSAAETQPR